MGQAKLRGTPEQRVQEGVAKRKVREAEQEQKRLKWEQMKQEEWKSLSKEQREFRAAMTYMAGTVFNNPLLGIDGFL